MAFGNGYIFGFATAVCVVCSLAVSSVSLTLRDRQQDNKRRDVQSNILQALALPEDGAKLKGEQIDAMWAERVELRFIDTSGALITGAEHDQDGDGDLDQEDAEAARLSVKGTEAPPPISSLYVRKDGERVGAMAIPVHGSGLWGPLSGYLALDPGATEVTGVTFFADKETPGLGAEITQPKFKDQFVGKKIVASDGKTQTIRVVKGAAADLCPDDLEHCVDGVSGATITARGVDVMIAKGLAIYDPYLQRVRGGSR